MLDTYRNCRILDLHRGREKLSLIPARTVRGGAERENRCSASFDLVVKNIFRDDIDFQPSIDPARRKQVDRRKSSKPKHILVVIKLFADRPQLCSNACNTSIVVSCLKGELVFCDLRNSQTFKRSIGREFCNSHIDEQISCRKIDIVPNAKLAVGFESAGTRLAEVLPLTRNQRWC